MSNLRLAAQSALAALRWHYDQGYSHCMTDAPRKRDAKVLRELGAALAEPVRLAHIEAVAEVVATDDGVGLAWLIEGGITDLPAGVALLISDVEITGADGSGEVVIPDEGVRA